MTDHTWPGILAQLLSGLSLSAEQAGWAMQQIMTGNATPAQFGAFVAGLRAKGETAAEIFGLVQTMRNVSEKVEVDGPVVDTCGTGGDRAGTINVSTISAFVVAGAGARVAKHGNRAASSSCGSADLLERLGVKIDLGPDGVKACIEDAGIGFMFAPIFHPGMKHAGPLRKELGIPTVFNFLGPLTNPAGARHQAVGVSDQSMAPRMAEVLRRLGTKHALIFHAFDGLDEISVAAPTSLWDLNGGRITECVIDPVDFGIDRAESVALQGGNADKNAGIAIEVLEGADGPPRDVVLVNSAAAIIAADLEPGFPEALLRAAESIDSKRARLALDRLIETSSKVGT